MNRDAALVTWHLAGRSFARFLPYWHFVNRESGEMLRFGAPESRCYRCPPGRCRGVGIWPGQQQLVDVMQRYPWLFGLKAGKLGFTELECAFDAWALLYRHPRARVHLFSADQKASRALLKYVKAGIAKLPPDWGVQFQSGMAGANTAQSLMVHPGFVEPEDIREIWSYPASDDVAIDQSCAHAHVDELSHMEHGDAVWNSVSTTIAPDGTCHIITRGKGDAAYSAQLWAAAKAAPADGVGHYPYPYPFFANYLARPDRTPEQRAQVADSGLMTMLGLSYFLPETEEDALRGDETSPYIPVERWDAITAAEGELPPLTPGDRTPLVIAIDAGVSNDFFAAVAVSRHPERHDEPAIRAVRCWRPADFVNGRVEFDVVENWICMLAEGGCPQGHARSMPRECPDCLAKNYAVPRMNVVVVTYDPHQLEDMSQRLTRLRVVWMDAFNQNEERLLADALMFRRAMQGTMTHNGDPTLREHIANSKAKLETEQESKMRIVKRAPDRKIDAAVAASMGVYRCLQLNL